MKTQTLKFSILFKTTSTTSYLLKILNYLCTLSVNPIANLFSFLTDVFSQFDDLGGADSCIGSFDSNPATS